MFKKIVKNIFTKTGIDAPTPPAQLTFERDHIEDVSLYEGQWLNLWKTPDSFEVCAYFDSEVNGQRLVGISHNYALARYLMRYEMLYAKVIAYSSNDVTVAIKYN